MFHIEKFISMLVHRLVKRIGPDRLPWRRGLGHAFLIGLSALSALLLLTATNPAPAQTLPPASGRQGPPAAPQGTPASSSSLPAAFNDSVLEALIGETLLRNPDLTEARAQLEALRQRIPQAGALPDPTLSLSYQNDGFTSLSYGEMETTWLSIMATQPLPLPGKRGLREAIASLDKDQGEAALTRVRLSLEAEVRRNYLDLLLVRDRLALLDQQETLWKQAEELSRTRYKVGQSTQADLMRAQLERGRLKQRRLALEAEARTRLASLNRLRGHSLGDAIPVETRLEALPIPLTRELNAALEAAEARSPELAQVRLGSRVARQQVALAERERLPDVALSAGVMPRGALMPMWQVGFSVPLPVFSGRKQARAVDERLAGQQALEAKVESVQQVLSLRVKERLEALEALARTIALYQDGLLVLSEATARSTLNQYAVGRVPFTSVLETFNGYLSDRENYLASLAQAYRLAIAEEEVSLAPTSALEAGSSGASMGGGGGMAPTARPAPSGYPGAAGPAGTSNSTSGMGM